MSGSWLTFASGIAVALAGSALAPIIVRFFERRSEREAVRGALRGEITAILGAIERRQYLRDLSAHIERIRKEGSVASFTFSVTRDPMPIFRAHIPQLGLLHRDEVEHISRFYLLGQALLEDIGDLNENRRTFANHEDCLRFHADMHRFFQEVVSQGLELQEKLRK